MKIKHQFQMVLWSAAFGALLLAAGSLYACAQPAALEVPLGGNTWRSGPGTHGGRLTENGIHRWSDSATAFTVYFRVGKPGQLKLGLRLSVPEGHSRLRVSIGRQSRILSVGGQDPQVVAAGAWTLQDTGYVAVRLRGISRSGPVYADIQSLLLDGEPVRDAAAFVRNNDGHFFYWGRRGPSVHLNYLTPDTAELEWFYNEITVPPGNDILGSYFMATGFGEGYFGMQVNSSTERHVLFSVWSPYQTDDPSQIPADQRIVLFRKGAGVHAGSFGNEGSGGQSYLNYPWKAGETYRFLLHGEPVGADRTAFTAYFYAPEDGRWRLIASFVRPHTRTWLTRLHSFLENFAPDQGDKERRVYFSRGWVCTRHGAWIALDSARFSVDNTGRRGYRMDYGGGSDGRRFFLRNDGFFADYAPAGSYFRRTVSGNPPAGIPQELP